MNILMRIAHYINQLRDLPPLFFRLILAFGFWLTFSMKVMGFDGFTEFLGSLGFPMPVFLAYVVTITEGLGVLLLVLGFATRLWTLPLMTLMIVAIITVHWDNGFLAMNDGFQIPLTYLLMLFSLFVTGPGKVSLDALVARKAVTRR